ncbi:MAG: tyrosine-type recombinase/integrase [Chlorobi bacterium]|nr:tyrosine-type recombinase/integrase [Chlorobiota bacterium]
MLQQITAFETYLQSLRRYSTKTVEAYLKDLKQFVSWVNEYGVSSWEEVDSSMIQSWLATLVRKGLSPRSIRRKKATLSSFFKFLVSKGIVPANVASTVEIPRVPKRLPQYVQEASLEGIIEDLKPAKEDPWDKWRDWLVFVMPLALGLRVSELCGIADKDIDFGREVVIVTGKGNKTREVPIATQLLRQIGYYIALRNKHFGISGGMLLLTNKGAPIYPRWVQRKIKSILAGYQIGNPHPHMLRHTFATLLLNKGVELITIKELLGHSSLAATQVYTHTSIEKIKQIYKQSHPLVNNHKIKPS